jgi:hypothetical protein
LNAPAAEAGAASAAAVNPAASQRRGLIARTVVAAIDRFLAFMIIILPFRPSIQRQLVTLSVQ